MYLGRTAEKRSRAEKNTKVVKQHKEMLAENKQKAKLYSY